MPARFLVFAAILALVLTSATPAAQAHGGAAVTIHSDGRGSVWITATWQDGHAISEPTTVTLTATGPSSATVAPSVLRQTGDERGTQTYSGTLDPPGSWQVSIELGPPVNGHCQAPLQVAAAATASPYPAEVACLIPATAPSADASTGSPAAGSLTPLWLTLAALALAAGAAFAWYRRRLR